MCDITAIGTCPPPPCSDMSLEIFLCNITHTSLVVLIIFLKYVNDGLRTHLFNTVQELFTEYYEKILQAYA